MSISSKLDQIHSQARQNRWLWYFSIFCRFALALGFIPSGLTKIIGERFASGLSANHPMGHYLEALHDTSYYYTFIGIAQLGAAILLLIPRTVVLGAMLYLPIILNICILSFAVRFDGSIVTSPLMVLANLYILLWNYDRVKFILPFKKFSEPVLLGKPEKYSNKFPFLFFTGVAATFGAVILFFIYGHEVMPRNSQSECQKQFIGTENETAGLNFCECIHTEGRSLNECLEVYEGAKK
ncbi:DoxX family protein [Leptobacterium flavescens]|uniref:DoxX family protein n=1 Tax=Leptobacterium flavescens TaxID=472055 RepID=A0A6P0USV6_9FLAO|nr:DoxX family protein [Leptobacterium flavescens]NER15068.1 DoxX family protein [Leptobacterium flavescens]